MSNNRKHPRVDSRLRCWCEGDNVTFYARMSNLSEGGLFLRTSTPLAEGSEAVVRIEVREPSEVQAKARARVVWTRPDGNGQMPGMGLRFEDIDDQSLEVIRRIIENEQRTRTEGAGSR